MKVFFTRAACPCGSSCQGAPGRRDGKQGYVEQRTVLNLFTGFDRMWILLIVGLQVGLPLPLYNCSLAAGTHVARSRHQQSPFPCRDTCGALSGTRGTPLCTEPQDMQPATEFACSCVRDCCRC